MGATTFGRDKRISADDAVALIGSGQTVAISGIVSMVVPERLLRALGEVYKASGAPRDLTIFCPNRAGWPASAPTGLEHLIHAGLTRRLITSTFNGRDTPDLVRLAIEGGIETYCYPMGLLFRLLRECVAQSPGLLTEVGLNTYADPRAVGAGTIEVSPGIAPQDLVAPVTIDGRICLLYRPIPIDVAIIRGTVADEDGNISLAGEPVSAGVKHLAMAARVRGGKVIAQVKHMTTRGSLHPRMVEVPGAFVDAVVVEPDSPQSQLSYFEPAFTGDVRDPDPPVLPLPFNHQKIILRRSALELRRGDIVNLGVGTGTKLPALAREEGFADQLTFSVEHGALGGVPAAGVPGKLGAFGAHYNPEAILDPTDLFDFYHGGGLDITFLGFAQVDAEGSINVGWFSRNLRGPGGFVDITHCTRTIVLSGTMTAGDLEVEISFAPTRVRIVSEGRDRKFIRRIDQVNLHGPSAVRKGQVVLIVTERCVFRVTAAGLELIEIAPGLAIDRDIRAVTEFDFAVSPELRVMQDKLFRAEPMGLRELPACEELKRS